MVSIFFNQTFFSAIYCTRVQKLRYEIFIRELKKLRKVHQGGVFESENLDTSCASLARAYLTRSQAVKPELCIIAFMEVRGRVRGE